MYPSSTAQTNYILHGSVNLLVYHKYLILTSYIWTCFKIRVEKPKPFKTCRIDIYHKLLTTWCGQSRAGHTRQLARQSDTFQQILSPVALQRQCHEIYNLYFFSWIEPIWAPDKHAEMVFLTNSFSRRCSNLKFEKVDSTQANTAGSRNFLTS